MGVRRAGREFFGDNPPPPPFLGLRLLKYLQNGGLGTAHSKGLRECLACGFWESAGGKGVSGLLCLFTAYYSIVVNNNRMFFGVEKLRGEGRMCCVAFLAAVGSGFLGGDDRKSGGKSAALQNVL